MFEDILASFHQRLKQLLSQPTYSFVDATSKEVPKLSGVYLIRNSTTKEIIYAGRSKNLRIRLLQQHKRGNIGGSQFRKALAQRYNLDNEPKITEYISINCSFQFLIIESFEEMVRFEHFITAILGPILNTQLKH